MVLKLPSALSGWFRSPLEAGLVVLLVHNCAVQDHSWVASAALCVLSVQHVLFEGARWQLGLLYMAVAMQAAGMQQKAAIVVIAVDVLITLGFCFLFPFLFPLEHQGSFKVGSVDLHLRPYQELALPEDTWGLRVRIFYPIPNKPPNFTTWRTLPRCVVLDAILLAAAFQVSGKAGLLTIASPMALSLALAAGVFFDIANVFAPKLPYLPEGLVTAKGFARYAGMPLVLFSHMTAFRINATADEPLLPPNASFDGCSALWPVMIFSHGLGGGRTAYSTLVTDLASKGIVVVCPEHADGSGAVTVLPDKKVISHEEIKVPRYEAEEHAIRQRQLNRRVRELHWIVRALSELNAGELSHIEGPSAALATLKSRMALDSLTLCGHSFGGATALHVMMDGKNGKLEASKTKALAEHIHSIICLDPWMYPLSEEVIETAPLKAPALIIHAEKWQWEINMQRETKVASRAEAGLIHLRLKDAGHHNYADFGLVAPRVSRYMKLIGNRDPKETMLVINHVVSSYVRTIFESRSLTMKPAEALVPFQHILAQQFGQYFDMLNSAE